MIGDLKLKLNHLKLTEPYLSAFFQHPEYLTGPNTSPGDSESPGEVFVFFIKIH